MNKNTNNEGYLRVLCKVYAMELWKSGENRRKNKFEYRNRDIYVFYCMELYIGNRWIIKIWNINMIKSNK